MGVSTLYIQDFWNGWGWVGGVERGEGEDGERDSGQGKRVSVEIEITAEIVVGTETSVKL